MPTLQDGLYQIAQTPSSSLGETEQVLIRQLSGLDSALDYALFRQFDQDIPPQLLAVVIDNERKTTAVSQEDIAEIHRKLWLYGGVPLLYVGNADKVDVIACSMAPIFDSNEKAKYNPIEIISDIDNALAQIYSAERLLNGTFWDDSERVASCNPGEFASHRVLLRKVNEVDKRIDGASNPSARRLLLQTLLAKYLEDRGVLTAGVFGAISKGARSILDLLRGRDVDSVVTLMERLDRRFNGGIFSLDDYRPTRKCIDALADFADEKVDVGGQQSFWKLYSFQYIPVEAISQIYEMFALEDTGSVYTPPSLVDLILYHAMPYSMLRGKPLEQLKVLDPTCGSGVFLVAALQRLFRAKQIDNDWQPLSPDVLKDILKTCIFGVDIQAEAIQVTAFSLALAVCDALPPPVIWGKLKFDTLQEKNLLVADFIRMSTDDDSNLPHDIAFFVGNPPFIGLKPDQIKNLPAHIPQKNLAYAVLNQACRHLRPGGCFALVQPTGILYKTTCFDFQKRLFSAKRIDSVLDFVSIRGMFEGGDTKIVVLVGCHEKPTEGHYVTHFTFRRTFGANAWKRYELDYYDKHRVSSNELIAPWVWRTTLLGGGRIRNMAIRFKQFPSLDDLVRQKNWSMGEGYKQGKKNASPEEKHRLKGMKCIPTEALTVEGIDETQIYEIDYDIEIPRTLTRYAPPMMLIGEKSELPTALWEKGALCYRNQIMGINAPAKDRAGLRRLYSYFKENRQIYNACNLLFSGKRLVEQATGILKEDIEKLPCPYNNNWDLAEWERVLIEDIVRYMDDYIRLGQNSTVLLRQADSTDMEAYSRLFIETLNELYPDLNHGNAFSENGLIAQVFFFGSKPEGRLFDQKQLVSLKNVLSKDICRSLRKIRILRVYDGNTFVIIKPDRLRYWLRSIALRDADDTLSELLNMGGF